MEFRQQSHTWFVKFLQLCDAKELLSFCEGFILKNLAVMVDVKNFKDTLFNNNGRDVSMLCSLFFVTAI